MILNKMQLFSEGGEYMKISRLVVSAVSLAVSAAMLTLSIIDLIRNDEYWFLHKNWETGKTVNSDSEKNKDLAGETQHLHGFLSP